MQRKIAFLANVIIKKTNEWLSFHKKGGGGGSMYVQENIVDVMYNSKMHNMSKNVIVSDADNGKAEVISGQGQTRPIKQTRTQVSGTNIYNGDS